MAGPLETEIRDDARDGLVLDQVVPSELTSSSSLSIHWRGGGFLGHHWLLGEFHAEILADATGANQSHGTVRPTAQAREGAQFFPAWNENELWFKFRFPRFGLTFVSQAPVRNAAEITSIPPFRTPYQLSQPTTLSHSRWRWLRVKIAQCVVRTMAEEHLNAKLISIRRVGAKVVIVADVINESDRATVDAVWSLSLASPSTSSAQIGRVKLQKDHPERITVTLEGRAVSGECKVCFRAGVLGPADLEGATTAPALVTI
jgi:hypothetical protein